MSSSDQSPAETIRISAVLPSDRGDGNRRNASDNHADQPSAPMSISTQETVTASNVQSQTRHIQPSTTIHRRKIKQYAVSTRWEREVAEGTMPTDINAYFCCCAKRIGNMFALASYPDGTPLVIAGPCWPFCVFITLPLVLAIPILVIYFVIIADTKFNLPNWLLAIYIPCFLFSLVALFCVSCRDPGLMERVTDEEAGEGGWFWK
jgi:hypothetical protein